MPGDLLFLSHAGEDVVKARELARHLRDTGIRVWLDADDLRPGDRWMESIEQALAQASAFAIYVGRLGVQRWVDRELRLALTRNADEPGFRIIPMLGEGADRERLPGFLKQFHFVTIPDYANFRDAAARIRELLNPASEPAGLVAQQAPFRGLERFDAADAIFFFGRDRAVEDLIDRMRGSSVVAVVGASGVGKSSLVRAGLLPALFRGRFCTAAGTPPVWRAAVFRPGDHALRELASALPQLKPEASDAERLDLRAACVRHLEDSAGDLYGILSVLTPEGSHSVLVVDQFEELLTLNTGARRQQFVELLSGSLAARGDRTLHFILTMRADFLSDCWQVPGLVALLDRRTYLVPPMEPQELEEVITGPLELIGGGMEPGLTKRILADLGADPGRLPLLQHALLQLWKRSSSGVLSHRSYEEIGGVGGALRNHAEEVYLNLPEPDRRLARAIFLRMVRASARARPTRRRVSRVEIDRLTGEAESVGRVLAQLIESRLVVGGVNASGGDDAPPEEQVVEIVHETLLENWQRYVDWIEEEIGSLRVEDELRVTVEQWQAAGRDAAYLFTGSRLRAAQLWAEEHRSIVTADIGGFLEESAAEFETISRLRSGEPPSSGMGWRIQADATEWLGANSDPEFLYRPAKLKRAREWADANPAMTTPLMVRFLDASEQHDRQGTAPPQEQADSILLRDLEAAYRLQVDTAGTWPTVEGFTFAGYWKAARYLSGDLAGARVMEDGKVAFWMADCAGKGAAAALYAASLQGLLLGAGLAMDSPDDVLAQVNRVLCAQKLTTRYATCLYGVLDPRSRIIRCANGGHMPPMIASRGSAARRVKVEGVPLGLLAQVTFEPVQFELAPGERFALFSDGVTEAVNSQEEEFGEKRLEAMLSTSWDVPASKLVDQIGATVESFSGQLGIIDDTSLLVIQAD